MTTDVAPDPTFAGALGRELGVREVRTGAWFTKLVTLYIQFHHARPLPPDERPANVRADKLIFKAAARSALSGAAAAATTTGATVLTLQTSGFAGIAAIPTAAAGIFFEMLYRAIVHVELTVDIARTYGIDLDVKDQGDVMRLYALAFGLEEAPGALGEARTLIDNVTRLSGSDVGDSIGSRLLGDALKRNGIPFMGIAASAVANFRLTRKLGETVHRYVRFETALKQALVDRMVAGGDHAELLVEGVWFMLTSDGKLAPEETAILVWLLKKMPRDARPRLTARFVEDEGDFLRRLREIDDPELKATLLRAFMVATAADGRPTLPERRLLRNAAKALGGELDLEAVNRIADDLNQTRAR